MFHEDGYPNTENWAEKQGDFKLFGYVMKHTFKCLI